MTSTDTAATGEDIAVGATTISSAMGNVTFNSGDTVTIDPGATLSSGMMLQINVDAGNADPGVGETLTLQGTLSGGTGITASGDADNDRLDASALTVAVTLLGNGGNDTLIGGSANDLLEGGADSDMLTGGGGNDTIDGGAGNELIIWNNGDGSDMIDGGADTDELEVNGSTVSPAGDAFTVSANGTRFEVTRADGGAGLGPFTLDVGTIETLDLNTFAGDDSLTVGDLSGVTDLATLDVDAGDGNDSIDLQGLAGGPVAQLTGGNGDDTVTASSGPEGGNGSADALLLNLNAGNGNLDYSVNGTAVFTAVPGAGADQVIINGSSDDDSLTIDFINGSPLASGGTFFNGGGQQAGGDDLTLNNGTFAGITHNFTNANDGTIDLTDGTTDSITYTGLEPIFDNLSAMDRIFEFRSASAETITISDDATGGNDISTIDSTEGEIVSFVSPTNSMTVEVNANGGSGADTINVQGLDSLFDADVTINGGDNDGVLFQTNATDVGTGNVTARGSAITILSPVTTAGGNLSFEATTDVFGLAQISSGGGNIIFNADTDQATTPGGSVVIDNSATVVSGGGDIVIGGGVDPSMTPAIAQAAGVMIGVGVEGAVLDSGTGNISIRGSSDIASDAVDIGNSAITSTTGSITIVGAATGSMGIATLLRPDTTISTTTGDISVAGNSSGMAMSGLFAFVNTSAGIMTETGVIDIVGTAGTGTDGITINGNASTVGGPFGGGAGVLLNFGATVTSVSAPIIINGTNPADSGVIVGDMSAVQSTGTGASAANITIPGNGGPGGFGGGDGIGTEGLISSVDGDIQLTGSAPGGDNGVEVEGSIQATGDGNVTLTSTDTAATGEDITIAAVTVSSATGNVTLNSGDTVVIDAGATVSAGMLLQINVDSGNADPGVGETLTLQGTLSGGSGITATGDSDDDQLDASALSAAITLQGNRGNDTLIGGSGNDLLEGAAGDDMLTGGAGDDTIDGGAGDELIVWNNGDGSDVIDGGADTDELEVNGSTVSPAGDMVTISANGTRFDLTRTDGGAGLGPFSLDVGTIETLDLNTLDGDDNVTVNDLTGVADLATLQIDAGAGNDTVDASALPDLGLSVLIEGGDDDDTLTGSAGPSMINGNMGNDSLIGGAAADTIMGGGGDDVMNGGAGGDMLSGQAGDDTMTGGLGDDTMNGGANADRIVESRDADFDLGDASLTISPSETDTLMDVEEADLNGGAAANTIDASDFSGTATLMGGDNDDTITGAMGSSVINGNMGNDELRGLDADDTIMGGGNDDAINGGGGADMLTGQAGNDTLTGGTGNDTMNGGDNDDLLIWNNSDGSDMMDGGADTDELEVNGSTVTPTGDDVTVSANGTRFDVTRADGGAGLGPFSLDVGTIETLDLNTLGGDDNVTVNDLTGVADLASIEVEGGDGADTIDASALPDLGLNVLLEGGNDNDTITGSAGPSAINGNMGNDSLIGGAAADTVMGGGGDDILNGGAGGDMLTGQAGNDTMTGDTGDDTMNGGADTDLIVETRDADFDLGDASLTISPTETDTLMDVEEADLTGGASANTIDASDFSGVATLTGNDGDDTMTGAQGSSMINGNMGNDSLLGLGAADGIMGGGGNDVIDGGAGNDTLTGQANDDTITGNTGDDNIMGGDGNDLINGSLGNDTISGDAGDDRIQGSNMTDYPGNPLSPIPDLNTLGLSDQDSLLGGAGADTIAGAIGADFIDGEADADIIDAQSGGDTTNGIDTIVGDIADTIFQDPEDTVL